MPHAPDVLIMALMLLPPAMTAGAARKPDQAAFCLDFAT